jgi:hypothetical protein
LIEPLFVPFMESVKHSLQLPNCRGPVADPLRDLDQLRRLESLHFQKLKALSKYASFEGCRTERFDHSIHAGPEDESDHGVKENQW